MPKAFFDTNVLIYQLDKRDAAKQKLCRDLVRDYAARGEAVVSTQILQEFYVVATSELRIDPSRVKRIIRTLENMEVVAVGVDLIHEAIDTSVQSDLSFWDALVIVAAESANCERLYSEDMSSGQTVRTVKITTPF